MCRALLSACTIICRVCSARCKHTRVCDGKDKEHLCMLGCAIVCSCSTRQQPTTPQTAEAPTQQLLAQRFLSMHALSPSARLTNGSLNPPLSAIEAFTCLPVKCARIPQCWVDLSLEPHQHLIKTYIRRCICCRLSGCKYNRVHNDDVE